MKKKTKKLTSVTPPEEPALTGKITDTLPLKFPPPMAVMKCEINFDIEKIKDLMAKHGLLDKLENPEPPKELPE